MNAVNLNKIPFSDYKITFGKYKGMSLRFIPDSYLHFLYERNLLKGKALTHYQHRFKLK
jgi:uncharacterized protein (DUF3820 family)